MGACKEDQQLNVEDHHYLQHDNYSYIYYCLLENRHTSCLKTDCLVLGFVTKQCRSALYAGTETFMSVLVQVSFIFQEP